MQHDVAAACQGYSLHPLSPVAAIAIAAETEHSMLRCRLTAPVQAILLDLSGVDVVGTQRKMGTADLGSGGQWKIRIDG